MKYLILLFFSFLFSFLSQGEELRIFPLSQAKIQKDSFVDISDQRLWPEDLTLKIKPSKRYRQKKNKGNDWDYHKLSYKKSGKILKFLNIKLSDKIFIYHVPTNKVTSFKVKNKLPLLVHQNPYGSGDDGVDYYFGFEIKNKDYPIKPDDYRDKYLVYIGKNNPFSKKELKKIRWEKTNNTHFPVDFFLKKHGLKNLDTINEEHKDSNGDNYYVEKTYKKESYIFKNGDYKYQLYFLIRNTAALYNDFSKTNESNNSYVIQVKKKGKKIFERFIRGSEGFSVGSFKDETVAQWSGKLFKNKPPVFYNSHESYSFGCNSIYFVDDTKEPINILCNNRH